MTLLTIATAIAANVGLTAPTQIVGSTDRDAVEIARVTKEAADEIIRRVNWPAMRVIYPMAGDGSTEYYAVPSDMMKPGSVWFGDYPLRPVSMLDVRSFSPQFGTPRFYYFRPTGLYIFPSLQNGATANLYYYSTRWNLNGQTTNNANMADDWTADDNTIRIPEDLVIKLSVVKWRRRKGMDFADFEAEYEAAIADYAKFAVGRDW